MSTWPPVARIAVAALVTMTDIDPDDVATRTPKNLADRLPFIRVRGTGGDADEITASPRLDVYVYAGSDEAAAELAAIVHTFLVDEVCGHQFGEYLVDDVRTDSLPTDVPYGNPEIYQHVASYTVSYRMT